MTRIPVLHHTNLTANKPKKKNIVHFLTRKTFLVANGHISTDEIVNSSQNTVYIYNSVVPPSIEWKEDAKVSRHSQRREKNKFIARVRFCFHVKCNKLPRKAKLDHHIRFLWSAVDDDSVRWPTFYYHSFYVLCLWS